MILLRKLTLGDVVQLFRRFENRLKSQVVHQQQQKQQQQNEKQQQPPF